MNTKITIDLTPNQLADVITCLEWCRGDAIGYGHVTVREQALHAANRERLITKLAQTQRDATQPLNSTHSAAPHKASQ